MSYSIKFKVKAEGVNEYVSVGDCDANITWNVRDIIIESTGLLWNNCANNGYCKHIIPFIEKGLKELQRHPERYKKYESPNGWGTVEDVKRFFEEILAAWKKFKQYESSKLVAVTTFWIE